MMISIMMLMLMTMVKVMTITMMMTMMMKGRSSLRRSLVGLVNDDGDGYDYNGGDDDGGNDQDDDDDDDDDDGDDDDDDKQECGGLRRSLVGLPPNCRLLPPQRITSNFFSPIIYLILPFSFQLFITNYFSKNNLQFCLINYVSIGTLLFSKFSVKHFKFVKKSINIWKFGQMLTFYKNLEFWKFFINFKN